MIEPFEGERAWVLVAGTGSRGAPLPKHQALAAKAVGRALGRRGFGLVTCGWKGVDKAVTQAFAGELQALGAPLSSRLKQIVPRPDEPAFFGGEVIYVEKGVPEWVESVRRAKAVVLIGGVKGTFKTFLTARSELVPVFPLPKTGGDAEKAFSDIEKSDDVSRHYRRVSWQELASLDQPVRTREEAEALAETLCDLLEKELSGHEPVLSEARVSASPSPAVAVPGGPKKPQKIDFLFVTALPEERDALLRRLPGFSRAAPRKDDVHVYFQADLPVASGAGHYRVVVLPLLGMGRVNAATATADAIKRWRPRHVVLVGIAGGVGARSVALGDLLVSEQVVDYELQKITEKGVEVRWSVHKASRRLYAASLNLIGDAWTKSIAEKRPGEGAPRIHVGPIASGDKVVAVESVLSEYRSVWPTLVGVEMEAAGVASACYAAAKQPEFFMVRGVSDLADGDKNGAVTESYRAYACDVAAAYAVELLRSHPIPFLKAQ